MPPPTVSIITPAFNASAFIAEALDCALAQTFPDWEMLVVDDASSDATPQIVQAYVQKDPRIRYHRLERNAGHAAARNQGAALASGRFLAVLDADDYWHPDKLLIQSQALEAHSGAVWSYHGMRMVRGTTIVRAEMGNDPGAGKLQQMVVHDHVVHSSIMMKRDAFLAVGGYATDLGPVVDWDLWTRFGKRFGDDAYVCIRQILGEYRLHSQNMSASAANMTRYDRRYLRRTLAGRAWGIRHPLLALKMLDGQIDRELDRHVKCGRLRRAAALALLSACARPTRGWRWRRFKQLFQGHPPAGDL